MFIEFDKQLQKITELVKEGKSARAIFLQMKDEGIPGSQDSFRKWFNDEFTELVNKRNRGRPKGKLRHSLGLLDDREQGNDKGLTALGILVPLKSPIPKNLQALLFDGVDLDIPLAHDYEPDYSGYAKKLGWRRVKTFGDMDYYFLARWAREIREIDAKNAAEAFDLNRRALQKAREIRSQMIDAVKPKRRRRSKK